MWYSLAQENCSQNTPGIPSIGRYGLAATRATLQSVNLGFFQRGPFLLKARKGKQKLLLRRIMTRIFSKKRIEKFPPIQHTLEFDRFGLIADLSYSSLLLNTYLEIHITDYEASLSHVQGEGVFRIAHYVTNQFYSRYEHLLVFRKRKTLLAHEPKSKTLFS